MAKDHNYWREGEAPIISLVVDAVEEPMTLSHDAPNLQMVQDRSLEEPEVEVTTTRYDVHKLEMELKEAQEQLRQQKAEIYELRKQLNETKSPELQIFQDDEIRFFEKGTMKGSA